MWAIREASGQRRPRARAILPRILGPDIGSQSGASIPVARLAIYRPRRLGQVCREKSPPNSQKTWEYLHLKQNADRAERKTAMGGVAAQTIISLHTSTPTPNNQVGPASLRTSTKP